MKKKNLYDLYLISREFPNGTFTSKELLSIFGYSSKSNLVSGCPIQYFAERLMYKHPRWIWKVRDVVAIQSSLVKIEYDAPVIPGPNGEKLRLINRNEVPFYLLTEYGGPVI